MHNLLKSYPIITDFYKIFSKMRSLILTILGLLLFIAVNCNDILAEKQDTTITRTLLSASTAEIDFCAKGVSDYTKQAKKARAKKVRRGSWNYSGDVLRVLLKNVSAAYNKAKRSGKKLRRRSSVLPANVKEEIKNDSELSKFVKIDSELKQFIE